MPQASNASLVPGFHGYWPVVTTAVFQITMCVFLNTLPRITIYRVSDIDYYIALDNFPLTIVEVLCQLITALASITRKAWLNIIKAWPLYLPFDYI